MKRVQDQDVFRKRVIVRVDFNVPIYKRKIWDDTRIKISLKTINYLLKKQADRVILISHLGRPEGRVVEELKLAIVAKRLAELLGFKEKIKVISLENFSAYRISENVFLLENIRFYKEEEKNDINFAQKLALLGDLYINDAFSVSHREHASTEGITHFLPSFAGFMLQQEIDSLNKLVKFPLRPFVCILGGAKVSEKIEVIENLKRKVDWFLLGGGMGNTFLSASGANLYDSLVAIDKIQRAKDFLKKIGKKIILPSHFIFGRLDGKKAVVDIGHKDVEKFARYIKQAKTIFWNGTLGLAEKKKYARGSLGVAKAIINRRAFKVCAGGDTVAFLNQYNLLSKFSFVSYGGGASLEFLAGKKFKALKNII